MKNGRLIPRNAVAICEMVKTSWQGRHLVKGDGEPVKGPVIPFGAMAEYRPMSAGDKSRLNHCGKKVVPGTVLGYALIAGDFWKGDILGCRH